MQKIETNHLILQQPTLNDALPLSHLWKNKLVRMFLGGTISEDNIKTKIDDLLSHWKEYNYGQWAVRGKNHGQLIGLCGPHCSDDGVEISYMFFPDFWGKGFAAEAVIASIGYTFDKLKIDELIAITQTINTKSRSLLEKVGFKHVNDFERFGALQSLYKLFGNEHYFSILK